MRQKTPSPRWHVVALERGTSRSQTASQPRRFRFGMNSWRCVMTSRVLVSLFALTLLPGAGPAGDSRASAIQGVWKTVEVTVAGPAAQTFRNVQPNLTILTGSHYARVEVHADSSRPVIADAAKATADELRATWG